MTKLGKALVVFVTVMSLAFVAFIGVTALGGPNWRTQAEELKDYSFAQTGGDVPVWEVTHRITGESVGSKPSLPEALVAAQRHKKQLQNEQITALDQKIERTRKMLEFEGKAIGLDAKGIETRLSQLSTQLGELELRVADVTRQGTEQTQLAETILAEADARRKDVERLEAELAQVRVDRYRVQEQIKQLEQRLIRLGGQINRAGHRQNQLQENVDQYNPAPTSAS